MKQEIRNKIIEESKDWITRSTLECIELKNWGGWACLGRKTGDTVGAWAFYDYDGKCLKKWCKLDFDILYEITRREVDNYLVFKTNSFISKRTSYSGRAALKCWVLGLDGNLYHSTWLLSGVCAESWNTLVRTKVSEAALDKEWGKYQDVFMEWGCDRWEGDGLDVEGRLMIWGKTGD